MKKGTSLQTDVFKPSVPQVMTHEPDLFDSLLRETSDKQRAAAAVDPASGEQMGEEEKEGEVKEDIKIGPQKPVPQPMRAWDAPVGLNPIAPDRATAIRNAAEEQGELSEGECSGSDNEMK